MHGEAIASVINGTRIFQQGSALPTLAMWPKKHETWFTVIIQSFFLWDIESQTEESPSRN